MITRYRAEIHPSETWLNHVGEPAYAIRDGKAVGGSVEPVAFVFGAARAHAVADAMNRVLSEAP